MTKRYDNGGRPALDQRKTPVKEVASAVHLEALQLAELRRATPRFEIVVAIAEAIGRFALEALVASPSSFVG